MFFIKRPSDDYKRYQKINPSLSSTINEVMHVLSGFCYSIVDHKQRLIKPPVVYQGSNVVYIFLNRLDEEAEKLFTVMKSIVSINMTHADNFAFDNATTCDFCKLPMVENDKVRNHCHLTGKLLGAAHNVCNLNYKIPDHIQVFFHLVPFVTI